MARTASHTRIVGSCVAAVLVLFTLWCPAHSANEVYESTARYNSLPWHFKLDKLFAFALAPLKKGPTNPLTYPDYPQWPFQGGPGYLVAIKFSESPIGAYSEIFYIPGQYRPSCSSKAYFSVQRIWVDSEASRHAGRSIWGIPKELATFDWQEGADADDKWTFLALTDNASGKVVFRANMTDLDMGPGVPLPSWLLPSNIRTVVQWPIDDTNNTFLESTKDFASTMIAKFTNIKPREGLRPILTQLTFDGKDATVAKVSDILFDAETFTGDANTRVTPIPLTVHLKEGSLASLSAPAYIDSC